MPPTEPAWLTIGLYLIAGFLLLAKGADWLVSGSSRLALRLGVAPILIGLTIVAWGTSAPEVVVSAMAAYEGQSALSLGNVLGSNIANLGLVLGLSALILPKVLETRMVARDIVWSLAAIGAVWLFCRDGAYTRTEAGLSLLLFGLYTFTLMRGPREEQVHDLAPSGARFLPAWLETLLGFVGVLIGAKLVVDGAVSGALRLGVDERVVGLTVVAVGTSLPELAASVGGALKGQCDLSLGNVIGSNLFNLLGVLGLVGLVRPLEAAQMATPERMAELSAAFEGALSKDLPMVLAFTVVALLMPFLGRSAGRSKGLLLLGAYVAYTLSLF